ncbi:hypothetical protein LEMLEM_LOCUS18964 [Lemmus lemmus]
MVMALKEIQSVNVQTPVSTSAIYCPTSAQAMPESSLQAETPDGCRNQAVPVGLWLCVILWTSDLLSATTDDNSTKGNSANECPNTFLQLCHLLSHICSNYSRHQSSSGGDGQDPEIDIFIPDTLKAAEFRPRQCLKPNCP